MKPDFMDKMQEYHDKANYIRSVYSSDPPKRLYCPMGGISCSYCEEIYIPAQFDDDGNFIDGDATDYRCNWHSTLITFDDGDFEWTEKPCC